MPRLLLAVALTLSAGPAVFAHEGGPPHTHPAGPSRAQTERIVLGWGEHAFATVPGWCQVPEGEHLGPTHGSAAVDKDGNVYVSLDSDRFGFGVAVYDASGKFVKGIAPGVVGLHSLQYREEDGAGYLYGAQTSAKRAVKLTLAGDLVWEIGWPEESGKYQDRNQYNPTSVTVGPGGEIFIADGYGQNWVHQYDKDRRYVRSFGGRGQGDGQFMTCHGLAIDPRGDEPRLVVCDRENRRLQYFDLEGNFLSISTTGLYRPCAIDFHGESAAIAELAGRAVILDKDNAVVSVLGDNPNDGFRANYRVEPKDWTEGVFNAPHGLAFDNDGNLVIEEWNQWGRVAFLERVDPADAPPAPQADSFSADPGKFGDWISGRARVRFSSTSEWDRPDEHAALVGASMPQLTSDYAFHTAQEAQPWVQIDLGREREVRAVSIWNRPGEANERAAGLALLGSVDGEGWVELWRAGSVQRVWEVGLDQPVRARYLRLQIRRDQPEYLHLKHIRVYGR